MCTGLEHQCEGLIVEEAQHCSASGSQLNNFEWWGENAYFSRQAATCNDLSGACVECLSSEDVDCYYCPSSGDCIAQDTTCPGVANGCVESPVNTETTSEGTPVTVEIDDWFFVPTETNSTSVDTSSQYTVEAIPQDDNCVAEIDEGSPNTVVVTPVTYFNGDCVVIVRASTTSFGPFSMEATLTVTVTSVNDAPLVLEDTFGDEVDVLTTMVEDTPVVLNACNMFFDPDQEDFDSFTITVTDGDNILTFSFDTNACDCYTEGVEATCDITVTPNAFASGAGQVTFVAFDAAQASASEVADFEVSNVNNVPVYTPFNVAGEMETFTVDESSTSTETYDVGSYFSDADDDDELEYSFGPGVLLVTDTADFDGSVAEITLTGTVSGLFILEVTATDGQGATAVGYLPLMINEENDSPVLSEDAPDQYTGTEFGSEEVELVDLITDEESSFDDGSLSCGNVVEDEVSATFSGSTMTLAYLEATTGARVRVTCTDADGADVDYEFTVVVDEALVEPVVLSQIADQSSETPSETEDVEVGVFDLSTFFFEAEGETLTYTAVSSDTTVAVVELSGSSLTVTMPAGAAGTATITVTATDEDNLSASFDFSVVAYRAISCSTQVQLAWDFSDDLSFDLTNYCSSTDDFTVVATLTSGSQALSAVTSVSTAGTVVTLSKSDACISGTLTLIVVSNDGQNEDATIFTVTSTIQDGDDNEDALDGDGAIIPVSSQELTYYVVASGPAAEGEVLITDNKIKIKVANLITQCSGGTPSYSLVELSSDEEGIVYDTSFTFTDGGLQIEPAVLTSLNSATGLLTISNAPLTVSLLRQWEYSTSVDVMVRGKVLRLTINVIKNYES